MRDRSDVGIAAAYDARAADYVALAGDLEQMDASDVAAIRRWRDGTQGVLLDAGCGPGHWTALLAQGGREARGIDLSAQFIETARRRHPQVPFDVGTFRDLPIDAGSVGGILAWYSLIHAPPGELSEVFAEFARVLRRDGSLLVGFFDGEPGESFGHAVTTAWFWSAETLGALLVDAGLEVVASARRERTPGEISARPHGMLIARRS